MRAVATGGQVALEQGGYTVIKAEGLDAVLRGGADAVLVCTSTTGQDDLPDNLQLLYHELKERVFLSLGIWLTASLRPGG